MAGEATVESLKSLDKKEKNDHSCRVVGISRNPYGSWESSTGPLRQ